MSRLSAFLILSKLRLISAVVFTGYTGMVMANLGIPDFFESFELIAILMITGISISIQNNLLDFNLDQHMQRTLDRKEAIELLNEKVLWVASVVVLLATLVYTFVFVSITSGALLVAVAFSYVIWYTLFLKRRSPFGTILGGLPGAIPLLVGNYAVADVLCVDVFLLFIFMMLWQPPHFWALSLKIQDQYDAADVPVMPVVFGEYYTKLFLYLYALTLLPVSLALVFFQGYGLVYFVGATFLGLYYLYETYRGVFKSTQYGRSFYASLVYILGLMFLIIFDIAMR